MIRIDIDGNTVMNHEVSIRTGELPSLDEIRKSLTPATGTFQPWSAVALGALGTELHAGSAAGHVPDITLTVTTHKDGWAMDLRRGQSGT
jgi:hypothetical protein